MAWEVMVTEMTTIYNRGKEKSISTSCHNLRLQQLKGHIGLERQESESDRNQPHSCTAEDWMKLALTVCFYFTSRSFLSQTCDLLFSICLFFRHLFSVSS